jgi:hypothetical protein
MDSGLARCENLRLKKRGKPGKPQHQGDEALRGSNIRWKPTVVFVMQVP